MELLDLCRGKCVQIKTNMYPSTLDGEEISNNVFLCSLTRCSLREKLSNPENHSSESVQLVKDGCGSNMY